MGSRAPIKDAEGRVIGIAVTTPFGETQEMDLSGNILLRRKATQAEQVSEIVSDPTRRHTLKRVRDRLGQRP